MTKTHIRFPDTRGNIHIVPVAGARLKKQINSGHKAHLKVTHGETHYFVDGVEVDVATFQALEKDLGV